MISIFLQLFVLITFSVAIHCFYLSKKQMVIAWGIMCFLQGLIAFFDVLIQEKI